LKTTKKCLDGVQKVSKSLICSCSLPPIRGHDANSGQTVLSARCDRSL
jgi:hypothetical protein